ncbi:MAG: hypothetical protein WD075_03695 [Rhodospirillales bacterium]
MDSNQVQGDEGVTIRGGQVVEIYYSTSSTLFMDGTVTPVQTGVQ